MQVLEALNNSLLVLALGSFVAAGGGPANQRQADDAADKIVSDCVESGGSVDQIKAGKPCVTIRRIMNWPTVTRANPPSGQELSPLRVVSIVPSNIALDVQQKLFSFGDAVMHGIWLPQVGAAYNITSSGMHRRVVGKPISTLKPAPCGGTPWTPDDVSNYIAKQIAPDLSLAHDGHTVYVLYLPNGCKVAFTATSTPSFHHGFPAAANAMGDGWAAVQTEDIPPGATLDETTDKYTVPASHEIIEAATNTGKVWGLFKASTPLNQQNIWITENGRLHVEVGDLCGGTRIRVPDTAGNFLYTRVFANKPTGDPCLPARPETYVNTTPHISQPLPFAQPTQPGWKTIAPSSSQTTVTFTIDGWLVGGAQGCSPPKWKIKAEKVIPGEANGLVPSSAVLNPSTIGNGRQATLTIVVPANTAPGQWLAVKVSTTPVGSDPDNDEKHVQMYGVFIK